MIEIQTEFESHFNEPVLAWNQLCRVIGYGEDESDCYLIVQQLGGKIVWQTAVCGYYWLDRLKGQCEVKPIDPFFEGVIWDDFLRLDEFLEFNGAPRQKEFLVVITIEGEKNHEVSI